MSVLTNSSLASLSMHEVRTIALILESELGASVALFDAITGVQLLNNNSSLENRSPPEVVRSWAAHTRPLITVADQQQFQAILPIRASGGVKLLGLTTLCRYATEEVDTAKEIRRLETLCRLLLDKIASTSGKPRESRSTDSQVCAVLSAYDVLFRNVRLHGNDGQFQRHALKAITEVVGVELSCWVMGETVTARAIPGAVAWSGWECRQLMAYLSERSDWDRPEVFIDNGCGTGPLATRFPQIANLIAVKTQSDAVTGYLILANKIKRTGRSASPAPNPAAGDVAGNAPPVSFGFTRGDAGLMSSFSTLIAAQSRTSQRHGELKELIVGLTRALTAAIDAKDGYTAGHSERVGRMAVVLGRELGLVEEQLNDIYLAGLLHDVGKIGIRDEVLGKIGSLTDSERAHIEEHVVIGHRILSGLSGIEALLGGVLHHHERYDGGGYPSRLAGDNIPRLARILAVADSFDAMNSDRPYRPGMPLEKVQAIFQEGRGKQWDPVIVDAFFRCLQQICNIQQQGIGESLREALNGVMRQEPADAQGSLKFKVR